MAATRRIVDAVGKKPDDMAVLAKDIGRAALHFDEMQTFRRMRTKGSRKALARAIRAVSANDALLEGTALALRNYEQWHSAHDRKPDANGVAFRRDTARGVCCPV